MSGEPPWAKELLHFWFEKIESGDWFSSSDAVDDELKDRFEAVLEAHGNRPAREFLSDPLTARAAILLFDQVPRNIYRDTERAFAFDPLALAIAKEAIARGWDEGIPDRERQFVAMPLMHSEDLATQEMCLDYFGKHLPDNLTYARSHHEMIARFGRFPHRNELLGRETTEAEQEAIEAGFSW